MGFTPDNDPLVMVAFVGPELELPDDYYPNVIDSNIRGGRVGCKPGRCRPGEAGEHVAVYWL
jgi:hypothetical protein